MAELDSGKLTKNTNEISCGFYWLTPFSALFSPKETITLLVYF